MIFLNKTTIAIALIHLCYLGLSTPIFAQKESLAPVPRIAASAQDTLKIKLQDPPKIKITEVFEAVGGAQKPGIAVSLPAAGFAETALDWKAYLKTLKVKTKLKKSEQGDYWFTDNAAIKSISDNTIDIYSTVEATPGGALLKVFTDLGGAFLSAKTHPEAYKNMSQILLDIATNTSANAMQNVLQGEEVVLKDLENKRTSLKKDEAQWKERLLQLQQAIKETQSALDENAKQQSATNQDTAKQIEKIEQWRHNLRSILPK